MLSRCMNTADYCNEAVQLAGQIALPRRVQPRRLMIVGMGGSSIGGELLRDWLRDELSIPIDVCNDYALPAYVDEDTLVFAVSYSGNTQETLSAFIDALRRECTTVSITSGGRLLSFSRKLQLPHLVIPSHLPPRVALPYTFCPLPIILSRLGVLSDVHAEIEDAIRQLTKVMAHNAPEIPAAENRAKTLALDVNGTVPIVYGFREYGAVAHRWKTQFNENSKVPSSFNVFPELNHNETVGWEASDVLTKTFSVILLRDRDEPPQIRHRIEATKVHALKKARQILEIYASGKTKLAKMLSVLYIGDLTSVYLALLRGVDPTPVRTIDVIKAEVETHLDTGQDLEAAIASLAQRRA
jgi:glucose/mannose-6-phosphate isomerase